MPDFDLQSRYCNVLLNELYDKEEIFNTSSIEQWYANCVYYITESWKEDLGINSKNTDKIFHKIYQIVGYPNGLKDQTYQHFKRFYEDEKMLGMLKDYQYTTRDEHIADLLKVELNKTCDWLIYLLINCIKYHLLRALDEDVQDVIAEYGIDYTDKILHTAYRKVEQINRLEPNIVSKYLTGYDKILQRFVNEYQSGKLTMSGNLQNKIISINEVKDFAHFNGSLLQGTDPFYIFSDEDKELYDSITQLNDRKIERKLQKLIGYR